MTKHYSFFSMTEKEKEILIKTVKNRSLMGIIFYTITTLLFYFTMNTSNMTTTSYVFTILFIVMLFVALSRDVVRYRMAQYITIDQIIEKRRKKKIVAFKVNEAMALIQTSPISRADVEAAREIVAEFQESHLLNEAVTEELMDMLSQGRKMCSEAVIVIELIQEQVSKHNMDFVNQLNNSVNLHEMMQEHIED